VKYKVGDKVKVRENLPLYMKAHCVSTFSPETLKYNGMIVTVSEVKKDQYKIEEDKGFYDWYEDMLEPVEEMSAEEAIRLYAKMCKDSNCDVCPVYEKSGKCGCEEFAINHPEKVIESLKQWKADHEKKPIETKWVWYVKIIEADTHLLKHEELLKTDFSIPMDKKKEEILKKYCSEHDGKYYVTDERRCVVKE
jgi:hypothetical protein